MGDLSPHFSNSEFRCHGFGHRGHPDHPTVVDPELVGRLEQLRAQLGGRPLRIVSGHRCDWWNRKVGGARGSKHIVGQAADLAAGVSTVGQASAAGFRGIGYCGGWAVHVDVREHRATFPDC